MSFKFTFREITPEDTEILRILKLRNAKPEEHICCEILRGDGITMKTWYSKADVALWGEDYIKANSKMKYIDGDWTVSLDVEPWKRTHGVSSKKVTSPSSHLAHRPCERVGGEAFAYRDTLFHHRQ